MPVNPILCISPAVKDMRNSMKNFMHNELLSAGADVSGDLFLVEYYNRIAGIFQY